jgi:hypothetical protein
MTEWIDVTLKCPADAVSEALRNHADWLDKLASIKVTFTVDLAQMYWERLSPHARNLFTLFALHPKQRYEAEWLAEALKIPHGRSGVAGVWAWPGRHAKELDMAYPWSWHSDGYDTWYWLEEAEAETYKPMAEEWAAQAEDWLKEIFGA